MLLLELSRETVPVGERILMFDQSQFEYSGNSSFALLVFRLIIRLEKSVVGYARLELSKRPPKNLITNFAHRPRLALRQTLLNKHSFYWHSWLSQDKRKKPILDSLIYFSNHKSIIPWLRLLRFIVVPEIFIIHISLSK